MRRADAGLGARVSLASWFVGISVGVCVLCLLPGNCGLELYVFIYTCLCVFCLLIIQTVRTWFL